MASSIVMTTTYTGYLLLRRPLGALLAIFTHCDRINASAERRMSRIVLPASILLTATVAWWASDNVKLVSHDLVQAVAFCCVISAASRGIGGPVGQFLEWKPMLYLGKISYGVYVYHPLMPVLSRFLLMKTVGLTLADKTLPVSGLALLLTIVIASLSWHLFERPI